MVELVVGGKVDVSRLLGKVFSSPGVNALLFVDLERDAVVEEAVLGSVASEAGLEEQTSASDAGSGGTGAGEDILISTKRF